MLGKLYRGYDSADLWDRFSVRAGTIFPELSLRIRSPRRHFLTIKHTEPALQKPEFL